MMLIAQSPETLASTGSDSVRKDSFAATMEKAFSESSASRLFNGYPFLTLSRDFQLLTASCGLSAFAIAKF